MTPPLRTLPILLLTACSTAGLRLPDPEPDHRREQLGATSETCWRGRCTTSLPLAERRVEVKHTASLSSPGVATGGRESRIRDAAGAVGGAILRELGVITTSTRIGLGTRTATYPGASLALRCEVAWIEENEREKDGDTERVDSARLGEGMSCTAAADSAAPPRWRLSAGMPVRGAGLRLAIDSAHARAMLGDETSFSLERLGPNGGIPAGRYTMEVHTGDRGIMGMSAERWRVRRADGTVVGAVLRSPVMSWAVDIAPGADEEEATVLRLFLASLAVRLSDT